MRIRITNFGPIEDFSFDLEHDLNFVFGLNNIGKSYAISLIYLILKNSISDMLILYGDFVFSPRAIEGKLNETLERAIESLVSSDDAEECDITDGLVEHCKTLFREYFVSSLEQSLTNSFSDISSLDNAHSSDRFEISIEVGPHRISIVPVGETLTIGELHVGFATAIAKRSQQNRHPRLNKQTGRLTTYLKDKEAFGHEISRFVLSKYTDFFGAIEREVRAIHFLPASRSGLYRAMTAFSQILAELSKKRSFLRNKIELPNISEPDLDYFTTINDIKSSRKPGEFSEIAEQLERGLLHGIVSYDTANKQISYRPEDTELDLEVLATSSMIAEISPIVLFLKYVIGREDLLGRGRRRKDAKPIIFIEEPEAHLHPEAQTILMESFVSLLAKGVRLVITSHSNYMFNKLNNLILDNRVDPKQVSCVVFRQTPNGSRSDYLEIDELGITDTNFIQASENLYDERVQILQKKNEEV